MLWKRIYAAWFGIHFLLITAVCFAGLFSLIAEGLIGSLLHGEEQAPGETLTPRQRQVLQLLAEGYSMKQVASELDLSARTVAFHKYQMMEQLKVKSTAELIRYAVKHHIV